jgi:hypothetical protein
VPCREPALRDELIDMVEAELAAAEAFFERCAAEPGAGPRARETPGRAGDAAHRGARRVGRGAAGGGGAARVNERNVDRLAAIIDEIGLAGTPHVGADGADAAWMLAQHADRRNEIDAAGWPLLAAAVASGDADPRHLAT